jgi:large subunit ribosomal protein L10
MLRSYVSILQTTPLILFFQHSNLKAMEWASVRRELARALQKTDNTLADSPNHSPIADSIKLQVIQTNMFEPALRITEYYNATSDAVPASPPPAHLSDLRLDPALTHALSTNAYTAAQPHYGAHPLSPLLTGSLAIVTFPTVSPQHVAAVLSVLAPKKPAFPAPTRRAAPSYYEPAVQDGLQKLMLLGARVEGRAFDESGVRWMGGIQGGLDGLRAQLVGLLQNAGVGLTSALEGLGKSLWMTMESRRTDMEEQAGGGKETAGEKKEDGA